MAVGRNAAVDLQVKMRDVYIQQIMSKWGQAVNKYRSYRGHSECVDLSLACISIHVTIKRQYRLVPPPASSLGRG